MSSLDRNVSDVAYVRGSREPIADGEAVARVHASVLNDNLWIGLTIEGDGWAHSWVRVSPEQAMGFASDLRAAAESQIANRPKSVDQALYEAVLSVPFSLSTNPREAAKRIRAHLQKNNNIVIVKE